jgi:TetR/AcrR family transcriptional regulator, tetracycline repressor protein
VAISRRNLPLSSERILDAAEGIARAEGVGALSMRRVAAELGTGAMSLYNHVPNKEALLGGLAERVLAQVEVPVGASQREVAASWVRSVRATFIANRALLPLVFTMPRREMIVGIARSLVEALMKTGMASDEARSVTAVLGRYVAGSLLFDGSSRGVDPELVEGNFERGLTALLDGLDLQAPATDGPD